MKLIEKILIVLVIVFTVYFMIDFFRFPDCYLTTWKYQLHNEILSGDAEAIEYYQTNYVDKGRVLFK